MLAVRKSNGQLRICLDPKAGLNKALKRQHYPLPVLDDILPSLSNDRMFSRWVPGFSEITAPIRQLLSQNTAFCWDEGVQGVAFRQLKTLLTTAPVLQYYDDSVRQLTIRCSCMSPTR